MKSSVRFVLASAALALAIPPASLLAFSDAEAAAGRALSTRFADAIVGVELVATINLSIGGHAVPPRQVQLDANGTMISADGLTVASLIEIDPRRTAEAATRSLSLVGGQRVQIGETEYKDIKLLLADGTEIPAKIVFTDVDRDLAFLAPVADAAAPKREFTWVKLADAAEPAVLGSYFVVSRASKSLQRVPEVNASTIEGVVEKPRQFFIPNGSVTGCPMLDLQGRVLGLCLTQMVDGHPLLVGGHPSGIVMPAADVADQARQASAKLVGQAIPPAAPPSTTETEATAGRALGKRFADAVVSVELMATINLSIGGRAAPPREIRLEANGTVISADGLTVTSLIEIDPRRTAEAATRNLTLTGGQRVQIGETQYRDIKLLLAGGAEIPAKIVFTDADRDLAFLAPVVDAAAAKREFTWVRLADAAEPAVLGNYFVVSRAAKSLQRVPEVHASTIEGIVEKPRQFFIPNGFVTGCPMLDLQGRVLGVCLTQMVDGHPMLVGGHPSGIIMPAAAVAEVARQATAKL